MTAVDTNVLVRLLTGDDARQAAAARALFASTHVWIAKTVLLETGWVLASLYKIDGASIRDAFVQLLGLPNVTCEDPDAVAAALELMRQGLDWADALHLSSRPRQAAFASFDQAFVSRATRAGARDVVLTR